MSPARSTETKPQQEQYIPIGKAFWVLMTVFGSVVMSGIGYLVHTSESDRQAQTAALDLLRTQQAEAMRELREEMVAIKTTFNAVMQHDLANVNKRLETVEAECNALQLENHRKDIAIERLRMQVENQNQSGS